MRKIINNKYFHKYNIIKKSIGFVLLTFLIFTFFSYTADAKRNYGKLTKSVEIKSQFKNGTVPENYSYYFTGWASKPEAVIGISPDYVLQSKMWTPINSEELSIQTVLAKMYTRNSRRGSYFGAWLKDHNDNSMGIYYSDTKDIKIKMAGDTQIDYITLITRSRHSGNYGSGADR